MRYAVENATLPFASYNLIVAVYYNVIVIVIAIVVVVVCSQIVRRL